MSSCAQCAEPTARASRLCEDHYREAIRRVRDELDGNAPPKRKEPEAVAARRQALAERIAQHVAAADHYPITRSQLAAALKVAASGPAMNEAVKLAESQGKLRAVGTNAPSAERGLYAP